MKTPVNRRTLKQHLTYNWWKYLLLLVIGVFGVDLLYTVTAHTIIMIVMRVCISIDLIRSFRQQRIFSEC